MELTFKPGGDSEEGVDAAGTAMTGRELELLLAAARYAKAHDDANPDVGMGPNSRQIVERVCRMLSFQVSEEDVKLVADRLANLRYRLRH